MFRDLPIFLYIYMFFLIIFSLLFFFLLIFFFSLSLPCSAFYLSILSESLASKDENRGNCLFFLDLGW